MKIIEQKTIELLEALGLTEYEANAYGILAFSGPLEAVEVADMTKIPRPRVYDILKKLNQKEFINIQEGKPTRYMAIPPSELVDKIRKKQEAKIEKVWSVGEELIKTTENLYSRMILPKELSWVIKGRENIRKQLDFMLDDAKRASVITFYDTTILLKDKRLLKKLGKLKVRIITDKRVNEIPGVELKIHPVREGFSMMVVDERECLISTVEGDSPVYNAGLLIVNPAICAGFEQCFDLIWKNI
ncbi:MAG: hypothetical protein JW778_02950 [Candidatus Altiarchaeota archaeon]|nr:hypothetical protein [Candidatus Altiarchaeota archaeon]